MLLKEILRTEYTARTAALTTEYRAEADARISCSLLSSELYRTAHTIFCFIGIKNEVDTLPFIRQAIAEGKHVCAPRTLGGGIMEARLITAETDLEQSDTGFGLIEPKPACHEVAPEEIDLIIVPCLSADPYGHRLGYGGGYYDRYLKKVKNDATAIAVCRDELLAMTLPSGKNDVGVHCYATESGIHPTISQQVGPAINTCNGSRIRSGMTVNQLIGEL